jgi:hypothetical protein
MPMTQNWNCLFVHESDIDNLGFDVNDTELIESHPSEPQSFSQLITIYDGSFN